MRQGTVTLAEINFDPSIYPRDKWNTHTVEEYVDALRGGNTFPPMTLEEGTNRLLDGVHRWKAYEAYTEAYRDHLANPSLMPGEDGWAPVPSNLPVEWHRIPDGIPPKLYAASLSAKHGDRISTAEKTKLAREIYETNPNFTLEALVQYLGGSKSTAAEYVKDIRAKRREEQKMVAYRLHRLGWTDEEIGGAVGIAKQNVPRDFSNHFPALENDVKKLLAEGIPHKDVAERYNMPLILVWAIDMSGRTDADRFKALKINCQPYDVWHFTTCHDLFGVKYPGRVPGELIAHALYFFTAPGDCVVDPMVGGGTTLDVCLALGRKCYAYDVAGIERPDRITHDLSEGWPDRVKKAALIFWDPPYFKKKEDDYAESSISNLDREKYLSFFKDRLTEAHSLVKPGTRLAFLMSDWDDLDGSSIFIWDYAKLLTEAGWRLIRHIQVPLSSQQVHPDIVNKFRESRRLARLERYLLIGQA